MKTKTSLTRTMCLKTMAGRLSTAGAFGLWLLVLALPALAQTQDYSYTNQNGAITITRYTSFGGAVTIPNTINGLPVTGIGSYAFTSCASLTSVMIPSSVASIGTFAFGKCTSLTAITVDTNNRAYSSVDGVLFDKGQTTLIQYPAGKTGGYAIPDSVTAIGNVA